MIFTKFVFLGQKENKDGHPGLWLAETFSTSPLNRRTEFEETWQQELNIVYQVCVFRANQKTKMAALASDLLRHFQLFLWMEFNETL